MRASDVPRATEPSLSTALRLRLSRRRKSTRRHWPRASLRRMSSRPNPSGRRACLVSPPVGGKLLPFFPAELAAPRQAAVRATARTRLLPGAPSSGRARAQPILFFVMITLQKPSDTLIILTYFDAPTTRANWTETFLPALKRPLPTSRGGWRGLRRLWWWTGCLDSSYDYGHRGQREPRVRTRPRLIVWGSVDGSRFCTRSRI